MAVELLNLIDHQDRFASEAGSSLRVYMHAYYADQLDNEHRYSRHYPDQRDRDIRGLLAAGEPILFYEDHRRVDYLERKLEMLRVSQAYLVETGPNSPNPKEVNCDAVINGVVIPSGVKHITLGGCILGLKRVTGRLTGESARFYAFHKWHSASEAWKELCSFADSLRKERGKLYADDWLKEGKLPFGCVGSAALDYFCAGVDVSFGPSSYAPVSTLEDEQEEYEQACASH